MIIIDILHAIIGLAFALFIPGFLLTKIIFKEQEILEKIAFSIAFSIGIDIFLGLFLGANETMFKLTGGITELNLWFYLIFITLLLGVILFIKEKKLLHK
ncbi:MAG: hypothetical protein Q8R18_00395 [bacterium]|nr:hypothetical protein [bacterium]